MTDLRNAVEDRLSAPTAASFAARPYAPQSASASYSGSAQATPMPAADYYQSRWDQLKDQRWFPMAVVGGVVLLFGLFVAYAYNQGASDGGAGGTAPVIAASDTPFKTQPADPGGMVVPNQDTLVFDQIAAPSTTAEGTETLVPPPEEPLVSADATTNVAPVTATATAAPAAATPAVASAVASETPQDIQPAPATTMAAMTQGETAPVAKAAIKEPVKAAAKPAVKKVEAPVVAALVVKPAPIVKPAPAAPVAQTAQTAPAILPPVAAPTPTPPVTQPSVQAAAGGSAKVQLGAFGSEAAAKAAWQTFQQKYGAQLGGVTPNFARADLGAKGVVYRVQGVGLAAATANSICQTINAQSAGGCIVIK